MAQGHDWHNINYCIEKSDVVDHYKDPTKPMQLRMMT